jgi:hypothetical protein
MNDPEIDLLIDKMKVVYDTPIKLHGGGYSKIKYEIENLTDKELIILANKLPDVDNIDIIISTGGGYRFARYVASRYNLPVFEYKKYNGDEFVRSITNKRLLVVDDVATTGKTLLEMYTYNDHIYLGIVIVKRGDFGLPFPLLYLKEVDKLNGDYILTNHVPAKTHDWFTVEEGIKCKKCKVIIYKDEYIEEVCSNE